MGLDLHGTAMVRALEYPLGGDELRARRTDSKGAGLGGEARGVVARQVAKEYVRHVTADAVDARRAGRARSALELGHLCG